MSDVMEQVIASADSLLLRARSRRARRLVRACGPGLITYGRLVIVHGEAVEIGSDFTSMGGAFLYADDGDLKIGDRCALNTNVVVGASHGSIRIGNDVIIGPNVVLRASDHGTVLGSVMRSQPHVRGEIIVEDDVWIGANAVITRDVRIGRGSVVGAGGVVTRDIPEYSIAVGVPARVIGKRRESISAVAASKRGAQ